MTLRSLITILIVTLLPHTAAAQDVVVKAGFNFATDSNPFDDTSQSRRTGLVAGIAVRVPIRDQFSVQFEGLYSEKGHSFGTGGIMGAASGDLRIRYLELPILWRGDVGPAGSSTRFYVIAGAAPALRLDARLAIEIPASGEDEVDRTDEIRKFDVGLTGGVGVEFERLVVDVRYTRGLLSIDANPRRVDDPAVTNRTFLVAVGYRLR